ncbi:MAG: hypothetical protein ACC662_00340, partial [Planctomycetota bacterium]
PAGVSGQAYDHVLPVVGGCGGPYVLSVIDGSLPPGLDLDDARHALGGVVLEAGSFSFTLQIVDSGCTPFQSARASFTFAATVGDVVIVDAFRDGESSLAPAGSTPQNPDYAALDDVVYNDFVSFDFVVAGGRGPYAMTLVDDPDIAEDGPLPLGISIPTASTSLVGSPVEVGPAGAPFVLSLEATDADGTTVADLLEDVDLLRVSVNPTGWWDDLHGLNPRAARPFQHGDRNTYVNYYGLLYPGSTSSTGSFRASQPSATSVQIPSCTSPGVTHDPAGGVYTDGGQLYVFDGDDYFGVFLVRSDSRVYVPVAFDKTTYTNFGDNWSQDHSSGSTHSMVQIPQMTVSPDGRFAALKLRKTLSRLETADDSALVVFSLTGERPAAWGNAPYRVVDTGSTGTTADGLYVFASSLTLTNRYLYYLVGGGDVDMLSWKDHWVYRYELLGSATAGTFLHPDFSADWPNTKDKPLQSPFQRYSDKFTEFTNAPNRLMTVRHGYNGTETSMAPHPFRVSADGNTLAILAGPSTTATSGTDVMAYHVWVDVDGTFRQLSSAARRAPQGGGRGTALRDGPESFPTFSWGGRTGPTTGFAVADDGLTVAVVVSRETSVDATKTYADTPDFTEREDVIAFRAKNGTDWTSGVTEIQITGDESTPADAPFSSKIIWRFGGLTFTRDGDGLVFWGGFSDYDPTATTDNLTYGYLKAKSLVGSLYAYDFSGSKLVGILDEADGGHEDGAGEVYTSKSQVDLTSTAAWTTDGGVIKPVGGFVSANGNFLYLVTSGATSTKRQNDLQLVGVNIRSLDTTASINGHTDGRGFIVGGLPQRYGFLPKYSGPFSVYGIGHYSYNSSSTPPFNSFYGSYAPGSTTGAGLQVLGLDGGRVFFATHRQLSGPTSGPGRTSVPERYGGPALATYYADYGYRQGQVGVFDANLGGDVQILTEEGLGSLTGSSLRPIVYLEASPDGRSVAFVYGDNTAIAYYGEKVGFVGDIDLDPATGDLLPGSFFASVTSSRGRAGSAMSFAPGGRRLYYAHVAGPSTTNENAKKLRAESFDSEGNGSALEYGFGPKNYNVLHAGR